MNETNSKPRLISGLLLMSFSLFGAALIIVLLGIAKAFGQGDLPIDPTIGSSAMSSSSSIPSSFTFNGKNFIGPVLYEIGLSIGWSFLYGILLFLGSLSILGFLGFLFASLFGMNRIKKGDQKWAPILSASLLVESFGWIILAFFLAFVTTFYWFLALLAFGVVGIFFALSELVKNKKHSSSLPRQN